MENKQIPKGENQIKSSNVKPNNDFEDKVLNKIFCPLCYQFPEYSIKFISSSSFNLVHDCLCGKIIESPIDLEKICEPFNFKCFYCKKDCELICVICKYCVCQKCSKKHTKIPEFENLLNSGANSNNNSVINIMKCQYICESHLLEYEFYCPICKINLCIKCRKEHFHINCPELKYQKDISKEINEPSDCFKKLFMLAKLFYDCYNINVSNGRLTLNILLNTNLADKILAFIQNNSPDKVKEIKNNFLNDADEKLYLCKEYGSSNFEDYYNDLLINSNCGRINAYYILYGILEKYETDFKRTIYNKNNLNQTYISSLDFRKESFINNINFAVVRIDLSETNIILANCLKMINDLKLKNNFLEFSLQLVKMISLKMNYKLDCELRRNVGNIISTVILKNFNKNLEPIQKSKKMLLYSSEYLKEKMNQNTPTKTNKDISKKSGGFEKLKSNYKLTLNMLRKEIKDELKSIENDNSLLFSKENINIIRFKNLDEKQEEIDKAIICNLFFTIKKKLANEFNYKIHNVTHSIDSLLVKEIESLENNTKEDIGLNEDEIQKEYSDSSIPEIEDSQDKNKNKNKIKKINKTCPKKYPFLESLNNLKVEKERRELFDKILDIDDDDDPIIESDIDGFVKILNDIRLTYCTSSNISIEDSLDLYLDGKKGNILKKDKSYKIVDNMIEKIKKITNEDESEINQILKLSDKIKYELRTNLEYLSSLMNKILNDLEKLWSLFDIEKLFSKYNIKNPLNPLLDIYKLNNQEDAKNNEELYFLALVFGYLFIKPKLKEIQKLNMNFKQIDLNEITRNNIIKRKIVKKLKGNITDFNMDSLISNVWEKFGENETFVEDKKMNDLMWSYIKNKTKEDFKSDLINLIKPYYKEIDLNSRDPQNITVEPFMIQNNLLELNE